MTSTYSTAEEDPATAQPEEAQRKTNKKQIKITKQAPRKNAYNK